MLERFKKFFRRDKTEDLVPGIIFERLTVKESLDLKEENRALKAHLENVSHVVYNLKDSRLGDITNDIYGVYQMCKISRYTRKQIDAMSPKEFKEAEETIEYNMKYGMLIL